MCPLFAVYVHRAAPACRAASVCNVYYVYGLAALFEPDEALSLALQSVLVMMRRVSN